MIFKNAKVYGIGIMRVSIALQIEKYRPEKLENVAAHADIINTSAFKYSVSASEANGAFVHSCGNIRRLLNLKSLGFMQLHA